MTIARKHFQALIANPMADLLRQAIRPAITFAKRGKRRNTGRLRTSAWTRKGYSQKTSIQKNHCLFQDRLRCWARVRNPNSEGWARLLRWNDDDQHVHKFAV